MLQEYFGETQANQPTSFDLISELLCRSESMDSNLRALRYQ